MLGDRLSVAAIEGDRYETFTIDAENPGAALRAELDARASSRGRSSIGLARSAVTVKPIELPAVVGRTHEMVKFELERHLPIPADDARVRLRAAAVGARRRGRPRRGRARAHRRRRSPHRSTARCGSPRRRSCGRCRSRWRRTICVALVEPIAAQRVAWLHRIGERPSCCLLHGSMPRVSRSFAAADDADAASRRPAGASRGARWRACDAVWVSGDDAAAGSLLELGVPITEPPWTATRHGHAWPICRAARRRRARDRQRPSDGGIRPLDLIPAALKPRRFTRPGDHHRRPAGGHGAARADRPASFPAFARAAASRE